MKFCYPTINDVFNISGQYVNTIVIENQKLFCDIITDISNQINGYKGAAVLSENDLILDISKTTELLSTFIPFDINKKSLITKIINVIEKQSINPDYYSGTMKLLTDTEIYLDKLVSGFDCNLTYSKITPSAIIKAAGIEIVDDYDNIAEKVIDYMELVREFDRDKLYVTINMRSFLNDNETELFMKTVIDHEYKVLMIENTEYSRLRYEKRITIDKDLCEF